MDTFLSLRIARSSAPLHYVSPRALKSKQNPNKTTNHHQKNPNEFIKHRFQIDAAEEDTLLADLYITAFSNLWHLQVFQIWLGSEISYCKGIYMMTNSKVEEFSIR